MTDTPIPFSWHLCALGRAGGVWGPQRYPDPVLSPWHSYTPRDNSLQSETVHYKRGVCQQFCVPSHTIDPSEWSEEEVGPDIPSVQMEAGGRLSSAPSHQAFPVSLQLGFDLDREVYPMVVQAVVDEGEGEEGVPCWDGFSWFAGIVKPAGQNLLLFLTAAVALPVPLHVPKP